MWTGLKSFNLRDNKIRLELGLEFVLGSHAKMFYQITCDKPTFSRTLETWELWFVLKENRIIQQTLGLDDQL